LRLEHNRRHQADHEKQHGEAGDLHARILHAR
jgi:hypothetical protein